LWFEKPGFAGCAAPARRMRAIAALGRSGASNLHLPRKYGAPHVPAKAWSGLDPGIGSPKNGMRQHIGW